MKITVADPPYPGQAAKHYAHDPRCAEVDHLELVQRLEVESPDGWALCTSSVALAHVLACCEGAGLRQAKADYRIGAWVKPFASFKPGVNPGYCWEPVIFRGGRKLGRDVDTVRDFVAESITLRKGLAGAKPERFCWWLFDFLGMRPGDELIDLYPGTGAVARAWGTYCTERLFQTIDAKTRACACGHPECGAVWRAALASEPGKSPSLVLIKR
jgi:hypothetical protein